MGSFVQVSKSVFGQDFGFSADPTSLVETSIDKTNKKNIFKVTLLQARFNDFANI